MTNILIGIIIGIIVGTILGAFISSYFDVANSEYHIEKLKAKKHGQIDIKQIKDNKPKRFKLFKRVFTKNRK